MDLPLPSAQAPSRQNIDSAIRHSAGHARRISSQQLDTSEIPFDISYLRAISGLVGAAMGETPAAASTGAFVEGTDSAATNSNLSQSSGNLRSPAMMPACEATVVNAQIMFQRPTPTLGKDILGFAVSQRNLNDFSQECTGLVGSRIQSSIELSSSETLSPAPMPASVSQVLRPTPLRPISTSATGAMYSHAASISAWNADLAAESPAVQVVQEQTAARSFDPQDSTEKEVEGTSKAEGEMILLKSEGGLSLEQRIQSTRTGSSQQDVLNLQESGPSFPMKEGSDEHDESIPLYPGAGGIAVDWLLNPQQLRSRISLNTTSHLDSQEPASLP